MPSPITEEAVRIIDAAPAQGPLQSTGYADVLSPRAGALAEVLRDRKVAKAAADYRAADARADQAQTWFKRLGGAAAYCGFGAAALAGVLLYLGDGPSQEALRANLGLAQFVLLVVSLLCAFVLFLSKPYRTWRTQRGDAEAMRLQFFAFMMSGRGVPRDGEAPLLPLQLECFRRHLLDDQRGFFARRGPQQRRTVLLWKVLGIVSLVLVLGASVPQLLRLAPFGLLPEFVRFFIVQLPFDQRGYALAGLFGGAIQGLVAALAAISPAQRNADRYKEMLGRLNEYAQAELDAARLAAAAGDADAVHEFVKRVSDELAAEGKEWLVLQQVLSELALGQLARQPKVSPTAS
jgi:hypothetical protein